MIQEEKTGVYGWDQENTQSLYGIRKDFRLAIPLKLTGNYEMQGEFNQRYIGTFRKKPNGRGATMNSENSELFEGFFKDGEKHGPFRSIEIS
jgi:hypothetical protein